MTPASRSKLLTKKKEALETHEGVLKRSLQYFWFYTERVGVPPIVHSAHYTVSLMQVSHLCLGRDVRLLTRNMTAPNNGMSEWLKQRAVVIAFLTAQNVFPIHTV